jgi:hypothetical protein
MSGKFGSMDILKWLKDWSVPLSAGATFLLAIAAFGTIWQNNKFRNKDQKSRQTNLRINKIQEWILEILGISSSGMPSGDGTERRNRIWRTERILYLKNSMLVEAQKLDGIFLLDHKLSRIINELSIIVEEQKSNPEALAAGDKTGGKGETVSQQIIRLGTETLRTLSDISDQL